ncbi:MAG: orotidine 5'-phosphate decarboxylase, partial [Actinomycetota bacterium]|nr:orotidine 5'-phosphate decarboxylase [Actinomycetota bacterium]
MSTSLRHLTRDNVTTALVQISLDLTSVKDALETATVAVEAGVDWIEVGTPLILAEGLHGVRALRKEFPNHPIVADLKTMDGGYLEAEMMADAGADAVVVMGQAHDATVIRVCEAGEKFGLLVMGDDLATTARVTEAARLEALGVGMIIHHIGYDHRGMFPAPSPLRDLAAIVAATTIPVQAVGG